MVTTEKKLCPFCGGAGTRKGITSSCSHCNISMYYKEWGYRPIEDGFRLLLDKRDVKIKILEKEREMLYQLLSNISKLREPPCTADLEVIAIHKRGR